MRYNDIDVKIELLTSGAIVPTYGSEGAAGLDLYAAETVEFTAGETRALSLGFMTEIPEGYHGRIESRSSMAIKGMVVLTGVIDEDYRGEWRAILHFTGPNVFNGGADVFRIAAGDRIAQVVFRPTVRAQMLLEDVNTATARGSGGFGSTGR
jgi:dUTP pyrophosphatase